MVWAGPGATGSGPRVNLALDVETVARAWADQPQAAVATMRDYFVDPRARRGSASTRLTAQPRRLRAVDYASRGEAERVAADIAALYREFRGDTTEPVAGAFLLDGA